MDKLWDYLADWMQPSVAALVPVKTDHHGCRVHPACSPGLD
jgi:hypothetical protein